jgi:hypothetical protein
VVTVMREMGIDLSEARPQRLTLAVSEPALPATAPDGDPTPAYPKSALPGARQGVGECNGERSRSLDTVRAPTAESSRVSVLLVPNAVRRAVVQRVFGSDRVRSHP